MSEATANLSPLARFIRLSRNILALFSSNALGRVVNFIVYVLVARTLGPYSYGQLSLAFILFYTFQVISVAGLRTLLIREIASHKEDTARYVSSGFVIILATSLLATVALLLFVIVMGYAPDTGRSVLIIGFALLPFALSALCEAVFQAWERMELIAYAQMPLHVLRLGAAYFLLTNGYRLEPLLYVIAASYVLLALTEAFLLIKNFNVRLNFDLPFTRRLLRTTSTFLALDFVIALWTSLQILLLSRLTSEVQVGIYNSAAQLLMPLSLVFQSVVLSLFPSMTRTAQLNMGQAKRLMEQTLELLLVVALPAATGLFLLSDEILLALYGQESFVLAAQVLRVLAALTVLWALTSALGQILLASSNERVTLRIVCINAVLALALGLVLIPRFGTVGAAYAALISGLVNLVQHYIPVRRLLAGVRLNFIWKPLVASGLMALFLLASSFNVWLTIVVAVIVYGAVFAGLEVLALGGLPGVKRKYRSFFAEG